MEYRIKLTQYAIEQLEDAVSYISDTLLSPETARKWSERLKASMLQLNTMPFRFAPVEEEPWRSEGVRKMTVENFLVYYWVNEQEATVWIIGVVYGRRDQLSALRNLPKM